VSTDSRAGLYLADAQRVTKLPGRQHLRSSSTAALADTYYGFPRSATERSQSLQQELGTAAIRSDVIKVSRII